MPAGGGPGKLGLLKLRDGVWSLDAEYEGGLGGSVDRTFMPHALDRNGNVMVTVDYLQPNSLWPRLFGLVLPMWVSPCGVGSAPPACSRGRQRDSRVHELLPAQLLTLLDGWVRTR